MLSRSWRGGKLRLDCAACGVSFYRYPSLKSATCSESCAGVLRRKPATCERCGKPTKRSGLRFCSRYCSGASRSGATHYAWKGGRRKSIAGKGRSGSENASFVDGRAAAADLVCQVCGVVFRGPAYRKTCSRFCGTRRGKRHPRWKGGLGRKGYPIEFNARLKARIKRRDNRRCVTCQSNSRLEIHHRDKDRRNNCDDNLVTLCGVCHRKLHANRFCLL